MLKHLTSTLAILSFSFSNACLAAATVKEKLEIKIPVDVFHRRPGGPPTISGTLWIAPNNSSDTALGRAVLLLGKIEKTGLAQSLHDVGFNVLSLDVRDNAKHGTKTLVEDIQTGVAFLKTNSRIQASRVLLLGVGRTADGAAHYASANGQMARIIDGLALVELGDLESLGKVQGIPTLLVDPKKNPGALCKTHCKTVSYKTKLGSEFRKAVVDFFLRPHG